MLYRKFVYKIIFKFVWIIVSNNKWMIDWCEGLKIYWVIDVIEGWKIYGRNWNWIILVVNWKFCYIIIGDWKFL